MRLPITWHTKGGGPIFLGGAVRYFTDRATKRTPEEGDTSPGVLFSSGYIAGGSVAAILVIFLSLIPRFEATVNLGGSLPMWWRDSSLPATVSIGLLVAVLAFFGMQRSSRPLVRTTDDEKT